MSEADDWNTEWPNILAPEALAKIQQVLEEQGPVIVEHRHYRGSSAPDRFVFDDYENFLEYLKSYARPGDVFWVWNYAELCKDENRIANGKYPDAEGRTPRRGAY